MRVSLEGKDFGFTLHPRRSRRHRAFNVTDANFADDLALITDSVAETQDFLRSLELAANSVGLHLNEGKTKYMGINIRDDDNSTLVAGSGKSIEKVDGFVYQGSRIKSSEKDFKVRKAKAWGACHQMKLVWKSAMRRELKVLRYDCSLLQLTPFFCMALKHGLLARPSQSVLMDVIREC